MKMRKITHLGIMTSLMLLSTQAFSADTLAKAFEEGKISGEIKSQYFQKEVADKKVSIWTNGGNLSYVTGDFYGFNAGVTVQASTVTADDLDNVPTAYDKDQNVSGAILSQAYIQYTKNNSSVKVGRQYISTPLLEGSGSRIFKEAFEGVVVTNNDISDTTILAAFVDKEQYRTKIASGGTEVKDVSDFEQIQDGAYTLYVNNKSITNLNLDAQYLQIDSNTTNKDDTKAFYVTTAYDIKPFTIAFQTYQTDNGEDTNSRGKA
ncbi:MAG: outer membrane porin, OprD family, partial [Erysipelotrichia bacterium]|nr:outer membrane porin, OprD family [Erysipelotrichia bacterium]